MKRFGKRERVRLQGGRWYASGSILSCSWLVCLDIFCRFVNSFLGGVVGVGMGGGKVGWFPDLHSLGSRWITALDSGSLLSLVAYLLEIRSAWYLSGGIDASTSRA